MQVKRMSANERERQRTEELNTAFKTLRGIVPSMPHDKLSKINTLKIASDYIRFLTKVS